MTAIITVKVVNILKIRIIGEKEEIDDFIKCLSELYHDISTSKLYSAREGGYRCYINVKKIRTHKKCTVSKKADKQIETDVKKIRNTQKPP